MTYDIVIIGGGIGGLMAAYRLPKENPNLKICVIDKGKAINKRKCPISLKQVDHCIKCKQCAIMEGIGGAGAFSDGKFNITTEYGGWLQEYLGDEVTLKYINQVSDILNEFGATDKCYMPSDEIKLECLKHDLQLQQAIVKHLGTDGNYRVMSALMDFLNERVTVITEDAVKDVVIANKEVILEKGESLNYKDLIIAVGRSGSEWFENWCYANNIEVSNNQVDIGVRVELPKIIWDEKGLGYSTKLCQCSECKTLNIIEYYEDCSLDINKDTRYYEYK